MRLLSPRLAWNFSMFGKLIKTGEARGVVLSEWGGIWSYQFCSFPLSVCWFFGALQLARWKTILSFQEHCLLLGGVKEYILSTLRALEKGSRNFPLNSNIYSQDMAFSSELWFREKGHCRKLVFWVVKKDTFWLRGHAKPRTYHSRSGEKTNPKNPKIISRHLIFLGRSEHLNPSDDILCVLKRGWCDVFQKVTGNLDDRCNAGYLFMFSSTMGNHHWNPFWLFRAKIKHVTSDEI